MNRTPKQQAIFETKKLFPNAPRDYRLQLARRHLHLCVDCGSEDLETTLRCAKHAAYQREKNHKKVVGPRKKRGSKYE